jgi:hypothetical protein
VYFLAVSQAMYSYCVLPGRVSGHFVYCVLPGRVSGHFVFSKCLAWLRFNPNRCASVETTSSAREVAI